LTATLCIAHLTAPCPRGPTASCSPSRLPDLARLQRIIGGNIERFAAREALTVTWTDRPDPTFKSFI
jgi:hypothetical protein